MSVVRNNAVRESLADFQRELKSIADIFISELPAQKSHEKQKRFLSTYFKLHATVEEWAELGRYNLKLDFLAEQGRELRAKNFADDKKKLANVNIKTKAQQDKFHAEYFQAEAGDPLLCALAKEKFRITTDALVEAGWEKFTKDKEVFLNDYKVVFEYKEPEDPVKW